jgi:hypothetical protein
MSPLDTAAFLILRTLALLLGLEDEWAVRWREWCLDRHVWRLQERFAAEPDAEIWVTRPVAKAFVKRGWFLVRCRKVQPVSRACGGGVHEISVRAAE